jgi:predicted metal-dependent hydrolase
MGVYRVETGILRTIKHLIVRYYKGRFYPWQGQTLPKITEENAL